MGVPSPSYSTNLPHPLLCEPLALGGGVSGRERIRWICGGRLGAMIVPASARCLGVI